MTGWVGRLLLRWRKPFRDGLSREQGRRFQPLMKGCFGSSKTIANSGRYAKVVNPMFTQIGARMAPTRLFIKARLYE